MAKIPYRQVALTGAIVEGDLATGLESTLIRTDGSAAFAADQSMGGYVLTNLGAPSNDNDAARKVYVDDAIAAINALDEKVVIQDVQSGDLADPDAAVINVDSGGTTVEAALAALFDFATTAGALATSTTSGVIPVLLEETGGSDAGDFNTSTGVPAAASRAADYRCEVLDLNGAEILDDGNGDAKVWAVITTSARDTTEANYNLRFFSGEWGSGNESAYTMPAGYVLFYPQIVSLDNLDRAALRMNTSMVSAEAAQLAAGQVDTSHLAATSVTAAKLGSDVAGAGLAGGNGSALTLDMDGLSAADIDQANDFIAFIDATDNSTKKESIVDLVLAQTGDGLTGSAAAGKFTVAADGDSISVGASGVKAGVYTELFGNPAAVAADDTDTTITLGFSPAGDCYVGVSVNGAMQEVGYGDKTKDCYFTNDNGSTAAARADLVSSSKLYWNGSSSFALATDDVVGRHGSSVI